MGSGKMDKQFGIENLVGSYIKQYNVKLDNNMGNNNSLYISEIRDNQFGNIIYSHSGEISFGEKCDRVKSQIKRSETNNKKYMNRFNSNIRYMRF